MPLSVRSATDLGLKRSQNEDSHTVWIPNDPAEHQRRGVLLLVADGMGGHEDGDARHEDTSMYEGFTTGERSGPAEALPRKPRSRPRRRMGPGEQGGALTSVARRGGGAAPART